MRNMFKFPKTRHILSIPKPIGMSNDFPADRLGTISYNDCMFHYNRPVNRNKIENIEEVKSSTYSDSLFMPYYDEIECQTVAFILDQCSNTIFEFKINFCSGSSIKWKFATYGEANSSFVKLIRNSGSKPF